MPLGVIWCHLVSLGFFALGAIRLVVIFVLMQGSRPDASESDADADVEPHPTYGTWSSSQTREPGSSNEPGLAYSGTGIGRYRYAMSSKSTLLQ